MTTALTESAANRPLLSNLPLELWRLRLPFLTTTEKLRFASHFTTKKTCVSLATMSFLETANRPNSCFSFVFLIILCRWISLSNSNNLYPRVKLSFKFCYQLICKFTRCDPNTVLCDLTTGVLPVNESFSSTCLFLYLICSQLWYNCKPYLPLTFFWAEYDI